MLLIISIQNLDKYLYILSIKHFLLQNSKKKIFFFTFTFKIEKVKDEKRFSKNKNHLKKIVDIFTVIIDAGFGIKLQNSKLVSKNIFLIVLFYLIL